MNDSISVNEKNGTKEILAPRQKLTARNETASEYESYGRKLKLIWSGDTHRGDSLESILDPGQQDTKKSKRTTTANFIIEIFREKNGEWLPCGSFSENVSDEISTSTEVYRIVAKRHQTGWLGLYKIRADESEQYELIRRFKEEEW